MITLSDNTATRLAINAIGLENINAYLQQMGLKITIIKDPTMLVEPPDSHTNFSTPDEMAQILWMIYHHRGLSQKSSKQLIAWMNYQRYRFGIWRGLPPGTYVANKTGHLEGITNDAGIIYTKKGNYILSIFTWGFKKTRTARRLINEISRVVYEDYTGEKVVRPKINAKRKLRLRSPKTPKHRLEPSSYKRQKKILHGFQTFPL
jgi:beta-lactamase class A